MEINMFQFIVNIVKSGCIVFLFSKALIIDAYADKIKLKCLVKSNSEVILSDQCWFYKEENTNCFSLNNLDNELPTPSYSDKVEINSISVCIVAKDKAEVRGITTLGINSRWGIAERDQSDKSCWIGDDFIICAWE
jgi:hypothetical protein